MIKKLKKGFTLIELVVVIAVIAILAAVSVVSYLAITNKAKESSDHSLIDQINTSVKASSILNKKHTLHEVLEDLKEDSGFGVEKLKPELKNAEFVYSYSMDKFAYYKDNKVVYPDDVAKNDKATGVDLWFFKDVESDSASATLEAGKSFYIRSMASNVTTLNVKGGLDVGSQSVENINYSNPGSAQNVVIRTNGGTLTVEAPNDTVTWFGSAFVNIESVYDDSFHAYGIPLGEVQIKAGHYVVENDAETNFAVKGNGVKIDTKTAQSVIVLKDTTVASYTVNGVEYADSAMISNKTKEADIDVSKTVINISTKALYDDLQDAIDAANENEKLVLLKDINVEPTHYDSINKRYYAIGVVDKSITINGNSKTITSDGLRNTSTSHDLIMCFASEEPAKTEYSIDFYNVIVESTHYQDVFLINGELVANITLNLSNASITCDGECVYSNGPKCKAVLNNCNFTHEGVYAEGKDDRYYSALIVGYGGIINAYNCNVESFGNGVTTFPSGGIVNLFNTDVRINAVSSVEVTGYAFRVTMENNSYEGTYVIRGAEVNVYGGNFEGNFSLKDTSEHYDAKINVYEGTFDTDPSEYVILGKTCTSSGGKWIVK